MLVVVMTDGLENSSTDYDAHAIAELVRGYDERPNWTFVYLGAGHANIRTRSTRRRGDGLRDANAMLWSADPVSTRKSMRSLAHATGQRRTSVAAQERALLRGRRPVRADYREDEPPGDATRSPSRRRVRGERGVRRRSTAATSATSSRRPIGPRHEAVRIPATPPRAGRQAKTPRPQELLEQRPRQPLPQRAQTDF